MRRSLASTALLAVMLGGLAAAPATATTRQVKADATTLLAFGQKLEAAGHQRQAGEVYRALAGDPDTNVRAEARYRLAKILLAQGKATEAAVLLRHVVDDHPKAAAPRLELAGALHQIGDESGALRELRTLGTLNLPLNVARFVDRMSASLQASRPFSFQLELALAPDSNINRATTSNTLGTVFGDFDFNEESKARSGVGAAVRGFVQGRLSIGRDAALQAHASVDANLYREQDFNDISFDVAAGPEFHLGPVRLAAEAGAGQQWYGMHAFQRSLRLSGSAWIKVDNASQLRIDSAMRWADNQFNDLQDGRGLSVAGRYERALSPRLTVSVGAGADRFAAKEDAYSTKSWTLAANAYRDIGRTTVDIGAELGRLKADDRLALLPEARSDLLTRVHVGAVFRQLTVAGFAPTMRIIVERNRSTVEYYDFKRTRTEFGVSRAF